MTIHDPPEALRERMIAHILRRDRGAAPWAAISRDQAKAILGRMLPAELTRLEIEVNDRGNPIPPPYDPYER